MFENAVVSQRFLGSSPGLKLSILWQHLLLFIPLQLRFILGFHRFWLRKFDSISISLRSILVASPFEIAKRSEGCPPKAS